MDAQKQVPEEGKRIITGQRILQTFSDPFLGSMNVGDRSFYVRQFRDMKDSVKVNKLNKNSFNAYTHMCAFILAVAHFQSPTAAMIYGYIAESKKNLISTLLIGQLLIANRYIKIMQLSRIILKVGSTKTN